MAQNSGQGGAYGGAPHGGPPGWGYGWIPPQAPKPGVIPLQPLQVSDVLSGAVSTVGRYWKPLLGIAATLYGGLAVLVGAALAIGYAALSDRIHTVFDTSRSSDIDWGDAGPLVITFGAVVLVALLLQMVCTGMMYATCGTVLQEAVLGRPTTYRAVWRRAWSRVPSVIGALLLSGLAVLVPVLLVAGVAVGLVFAAASQHNTPLAITVGVLGGVALLPLVIWLGVLFGLAPAAVVLERQGPVGALRRSARLVRGAWWRTFGITLLAGVIGAALAYFIQLPFNIAGMFSSLSVDLGAHHSPSDAQLFSSFLGYTALVLVGQSLSQIFSTTFPQLVTGLLYVDRRIRKENLAPALVEAAAADVTGSG
ncbi:hypothetical protein OG709_07545 [Streptomyces sp. NBC_01267]|uniref:DUF7847 domain-containing protein n=1 Tax=Streptomyces sp. NBC_01267 TaxID=2903805 RepID=UPI002E339C7C|nr:hypothetical protein [Streptomyces sp. NBC_01267]